MITQELIQQIKEGDTQTQFRQRTPQASTRLTEEELKTSGQAITSPQVQRTEKIDTFGEAFGAGFKAGGLNIAAQNKNFAATVNTIMGNEEAAQRRLKEADFIEEQGGLALAGLEADFATAIEERDVHDFFLNFASATGQFIPSLGASMVEAAIGAGIVVGGSVLTGGTATPALIAGAAASSSLRRKGIKKALPNLQRRNAGITVDEAENLFNKAYINQVAVAAGKTPRYPLSTQDKRNLATLYSGIRESKKGRRAIQGGLLGAFSQEQRMGTGIAFSDYADEGMTSKSDAIKALAQGQLFGAAGVITEAAAAGITFRQLSKGARTKKRVKDDPFDPGLAPASSMFKDFAVITGATSLSEGIAELAQEELSVQQKFRIKDDYTKAQARIDRINALFAGLMGGVGVGGGLGSATAVSNKLRTIGQRNAAERELARIFTTREGQAMLGRVMGERPKALITQAQYAADPKNPVDSFFVDIDSKANYKKAQSQIEKAGDFISVATPIGAFFTTNEVKAQRLANIMDSPAKFDTGVLEAFLADALGYSEARNDNHNMVVGIFDTQTNEFTKYQSTNQDPGTNQFEKAKSAMKTLLGTMDRKRYKIISQPLAEHRAFRMKGLQPGTTTFSSIKEAFQTDETGIESASEMNTSQDDIGNVSDRGARDPRVSAANIDIRKGRVNQETRAELDNYIQEEYNLPINFSDLVFYVDSVKKMSGAKSVKEMANRVGPVGSKQRLRFLEIDQDIKNAEENTIARQEDRDYFDKLQTFEGRAENMNMLLEALAEDEGGILSGNQGIQQRTSVDSSLGREEGGVELDNVPLVGVSEILKEANVDVSGLAKEDAATVREPIRQDSEAIRKRGGTGTVENPYVDPKTKQPFKISKTDPAATKEQLDGLFNDHGHSTLRQEFEQQRPFLSQRAVETFRKKAEEESRTTNNFGFVRFVEVRNLPKLRTASKKGDPYISSPPTNKQGVPYKKQSFVIVRMQPEEKAFQELTRENISRFRNRRKDFELRFRQAHDRTLGKNYKKKNIFFKMRDTSPEARSKKPIDIDISVMLEGVTTITRLTGLRSTQELQNDAAKRVAAILDLVDLSKQFGFELQFFPEGVLGKAEPLNLLETGRGPDGMGPVNKNINKAFTMLTQPGPMSKAIFKFYVDPASRDFNKQLVRLNKRMGLSFLGTNNLDREAAFNDIEVPLINLAENATEQDLLVDILQNFDFFTENKNIVLGDLNTVQLRELNEAVQDAMSITLPLNSGVEAGEARSLNSEFEAQDRILTKLYNITVRPLRALEKQNVKDDPGVYKPSRTIQVPKRDKDGNVVTTTSTVESSVTGKKEKKEFIVYDTLKQPGFEGGADSINELLPISTYAEAIDAIRVEAATPALDDTGLFDPDGPPTPGFAAPVDNSAAKINVNDGDLFESMQAQQGQETRGRDRYADMMRGGKKPKETRRKKSNHPKYKKLTTISFENTFKARKESLKKNATAEQDTTDTTKPAPKQEKPQVQMELDLQFAKEPTRAKLPFRLTILNNLIAGARAVGLQSNLKILSAEENLYDSQLPTEVKKSIDLKQFEEKRQKLLSMPNKTAMTLKYEYFDVIMMKTNPDVTEGNYYKDFLKELGNSLTFQELDDSLQVPADRKNILNEFAERLKRDDVPANYTNDDTGIENFIADQFALAVREKVGLSVDGTLYDQMSNPAKAWFRRLANSQQKMYQKLSPAQRSRLEISQTFAEYAENLADNIRNPENQEVSYKTKAKIESMIDQALGPQTFSDKQIRKVVEQAQKLLRSKNFPSWMQKIFLTSDTRMRNYTGITATAGKDIADFYNQDPRTESNIGMSGLFTRKNRRAAKLHNQLAKAAGVKTGYIFQTLDDEQRNAFDLAADDSIKTANLPPLAQSIRNYFKKVYDDLGLKDLGVDFKEDFFPRVIDIAELSGNERLQEVTRKLLKEYNPKATQAQINDVLNHTVARGSGELNFEANNPLEVGMMKERKKYWNNIPNKALIDAGIAVPAEVAAKLYLDKAAMAFEFDKSGGVRKLEQLRSRLTPEEQADHQRIHDSMFGKTPPIKQGWLKWANNILLPVNIVTLLAFTVLASLQDTAGPILRARGTAKISDITDTIKNMIKNPQEAAEVAREIGTAGIDAMSSFFIYAGEQNYMSQVSKNISDIWFRYTGLEAYTRFTRIFATHMGFKFLSKHSNNPDPESEAYLKELNITAKEFKAYEKGKASKQVRERVDEAVAQFVDESIVRPNPAQRPTYANDPRYALIWQLKSFFYAYGKTIVFPTLKESHRNFVNKGAGAGAMPLLFMASVLLPITMLGLEIREFWKAALAWLLPGINPNDPGVDYFKTDNMSMGQYMTEILDRSGMLGPYTMALPLFMESKRYGQPFWVPPLGPTAERVYDGITWDWQAADYIPVYSQLDTRALQR